MENLDEFMEKAEIVQEYFDNYLQKDIAQTMEHFDDENSTKAGIFQTLLDELIVRAKMQEITLEMFQEMLKVGYEDIQLIPVNKDYQ